MLESREPLQSAAVLFGGYADGQWTLPEPMTEAREHVLRVTGLLEEASAETPEDPFDIRDRLACGIANGSEVDVAPIRAAEEHQADHDHRLSPAVA